MMTLNSEGDPLVQLEMKDTLNSIWLDKEGNVGLYAENELEIIAEADMKIEAKGDLTIKASKIDLNP